MKELISKIQNGMCRAIGEILLEAKLVNEQDIEAAIEEQRQTHELLGQILVRKGLISQTQLVDILEIQLNNRNMSAVQMKRKLGEILVDKAIITRWQLAQALEQKGFSLKKTGEILIDLGYTTKGNIEEAISHQAIGANRPAPPRRKTLGQFLLEANRLTPTQLAEALAEQQQTHEYLGAILIRNEWLTHEELDDLLATQLLAENNGQSLTKKLGEILVEFRQISKSQLDLAISIQKGCQRKLGDILVELKFLPHWEVSRALRLQKRLATLAMTTILGITMLNGCGTPTVPPQMAMPNSFQLTQSAPTMRYAPPSSAVSGPFKTLQLDGGHTMKIHKNGSKVLDGVPFMKQGDDNTCGQAVITMVLNYWGNSMTYQQVVNESNRYNMPTTNDALTRYFRTKGLNAQDYRGASMDNLLAQINKGRPTIVMLDFGGLSQEHYVVVIGYNEKKGTLIMHDSIEGPNVEMDMQVFNRMWENKAATSLPILGGSNYQKLMFDVFG